MLYRRTSRLLLSCAAIMDQIVKGRYRFAASMRLAFSRSSRSLRVSSPMRYNSFRPFSDVRNSSNFLCRRLSSSDSIGVLLKPSRFLRQNFPAGRYGVLVFGILTSLLAESKQDSQSELMPVIA